MGVLFIVQLLYSKMIISDNNKFLESVVYRLKPNKQKILYIQEKCDYVLLLALSYISLSLLTQWALSSTNMDRVYPTGSILTNQDF